MSQLHILVIVGSTRDGRYGDKPAHWIAGKLAERPELTVEVADLRDHPLPMFDHAVAPGRVTDGNYGNPTANAWAKTVAAADGFVATAAEYNHGYTAVLKNALDWAFREWHRKPITFVGYGGVGGARAVEQLRQVAVELELAPLRQAVHLTREIIMATRPVPSPVDPQLFAPADASAKLMIDDLIWWARALRQARGY